MLIMNCKKGINQVLMINKDLHPHCRIARKHRLMQTLKTVPGIDDMSVLEIGCGYGYAPEYMDFRVYEGIDSGKNVLTDLWKKRSATRFYNLQDVLTYTPVTQYDLVFCIGVLHHIMNDFKALERMYLLTKPGGYCVINEPCNKNKLLQYLRGLYCKLSDDYDPRQVQYHDYVLIKMFEHVGFKDIAIKHQGTFSTPFAECAGLKPAWLMNWLSKLSVKADAWIERRSWHVPTWNVIVVGRKE